VGADSGRTAADNRLFVNGVLWVLRSGAHREDLPERYGEYRSVHKRFTRWAKAGVWEKVFTGPIKDRDNKYLMPDTTLSLWRMNDENHPLIRVAAVVGSLDMDSLGLGGNGRAVTFTPGQLGR
jgi:hypothetical protein